MMCRIGLLMVAAALVAMLACTGAAAGAEWHVYPGEGTPIQTAIDGASEEDTVYVHEGEYCENVNIATAHLKLTDGGAGVVTVTAASSSDYVFEVTADWVNISGFKVSGATHCAGIYLNNTNHCYISDNAVSNNRYGIWLSSSSDNMLADNNVSNNGHGICLDHSSSKNTLMDNIASDNELGICLWYSSNNVLTNNNASDNVWGIHLYFSSNNMLTNNTMSENVYNFGVWSYSLLEYVQDIDTSNTVDGKPIYYWIDQQDKQIPDDAGFVGVVNSTNITVSDLILTNNRQGALFAYTEDSRIENIAVSNNELGICLRNSRNNMLTNNTASDNHGGICLSHSNSNMLTNNTASDNEWCGIRLDYSSSENTLVDTNASNNGDGIHLSASSNNMLKNTTMSRNAHNFGVDGNSLSHYAQNIDTSNKADGKPIYYWIDQQDKQIPDDAGFVGVVNSTNITVRDMRLTNNIEAVLFAYTENSKIENVTTSNNERGIYLDFSNNNTIIDNTASNNDWCGIYIDSSSNNTLVGNSASNNECGIHIGKSSNNLLTNNNVSDNEGEGIDLWYSSNNTLQSNTATNNYHGIFLWYSSDNMLYHNKLLGNTKHNAYDSDGTNAWDSGSAGNYYSDYNGTDPDGDGIGNDPHPIPGGGGSVDNCPLMQPWTGGTQQLGDLNGDNQITPADAAIALAIAASGGWDADADVSGDHRVTSLDALMILQECRHSKRVISSGGA